MKSKVAIVGTGPAALMAAQVLGMGGLEVHLIEKRPSAGRKLLIAGSSGLNITHSLSLPEFSRQYSGPSSFWNHLLSEFSPKDWIQFIERLGIKTFKGTSGRYFVESMTAAKLLTTWRKKLNSLGVQWHFNVECADFVPIQNRWRLICGKQSQFDADAVLFALGGGSYEPDEKPLRWPAMFKNKKIQFNPFTPSNVGHRVEWS